MKKIIVIIFSFIIVFFITIAWIISYKIIFTDLKNNKIKITQNNKNFKKENYFYVIPNSNFSSNYFNNFINFIHKKTNNVKNIVLITKAEINQEEFFKSFNFDSNYCTWAPFKNPIPNCFYWKKFNFYSWKNTFKFFPPTNTFFSYNYKNNLIYSLAKKYFWKNINFYDIQIQKKWNSEKLNSLAKKLNNYKYNWNTIYLAIWDFSKFNIDKIAVFKDLNSINSLSLKENKNIDVECPNCLNLIKKLAQKQDKKFFNIYNREISNTKNIFTHKKSRISHIYWEFKRVLNDKINKNKAFLTTFQKTTFNNDFIITPKEDNKKVYLAFFWDTHFTRWFNYADSLKRKNDYFKCFYENFDKTKFLEKYTSRMFYWLDLIWVNLETSVALEDECDFYKKEIRLRTEPKYLKDFKKVWINLFNLANNHSYDCSKKWLDATMKHLKENNLNFFWNPTNNWFNTLKKEINWLKIAFIWINTIWVKLDVDEVSKEIKKLKAKNYLVILNIHWWEEFLDKITEEQKDLARRFVNDWVNLIIWHHPHVVQDYEIYSWVPIFYSLWNFIFDQHFKNTLKWEWVFLELSKTWVKFNTITFFRDPLNWEIKCKTIQ